jgi:hypothetical protein
MTDIQFEKSIIVGNQQVTGQQLTSKVRVVAILDEKGAEKLGVRYSLFQHNGVIRFGPKAIELEIQFDNAWFSHEIPRIGKLTLPGCTISKLKAFRTGDGKKKPKRMMLAFQVAYTGGPFELIEHMVKIGRGAGVSVIKPTAEQMELVPPEEPTEDPAPDVTLHSLHLTTGERVDREAGEVTVEVVRDPVSLTYDQKGWTARITLAEAEGGYSVVYAAKSPNRKLPARAPMVFTSETNARQAGALAIKGWCDKVIAGGTKPEKREATKMLSWAMDLIPSEAIIENAGVDRATGA